jgi:hypothetical protein
MVDCNQKRGNSAHAIKRGKPPVGLRSGHPHPADLFACLESVSRNELSLWGDEWHWYIAG